MDYILKTYGFTSGIAHAYKNMLYETVSYVKLGVVIHVNPLRYIPMEIIVIMITTNITPISS